METQIRNRIKANNERSEWSEEPPFPKEIMLELTNVCNHSCNFCAISSSSREKGFADRELMERLMTEARSFGSEVIAFHSGAEPFVARDLEEHVGFAKNLGYTYIYLTTNGALATPDRIAKIFDSGLDSIKFSVNGGTAEVYDAIHGQDHFERVISHIRFANKYRKEKELDVYIGISFVETIENTHTFENLESLIGDEVDEIFRYSVLNQNGQTPGISDLNVKHAPCPLPFKRIHVSQEGYLRTCCSDYQNNLALVDLKDTTLKDALYTDDFREIRRKHLEDDLKGTLCYNCTYNVNEPIEPLNPDLATPNPDGFFDLRPNLGVPQAEALLSID